MLCPGCQRNATEKRIEGLEEQIDKGAENSASAWDRLRVDIENLKANAELGKGASNPNPKEGHHDSGTGMRTPP